MAVSTKPSIFIQRPILSSVISIIITLAGFIAMTALPIAQYPDMIPPTVNVEASYPGASAVVVSENVMAPLEVQINGVEHMLYMNSSSAAGMGRLDIYFSLGTNPDMALVNVCNKVNLAQTLLPETVRSLGVTVTKRSPAFLLLLAMYSPNGSHDRYYINNYLQMSIVDELKRVEGVGSAEMFGKGIYSMRIWVYPDKLAKLALTANDICNAIKEQNSQFAPGRIGDLPSKRGIELSWQIDTLGRLPDVQSFENIIIRTGKNSSKVLLKDVARVELGAQDYSVKDYFSGKSAAMGGIYLLPGANAIDTGKRVEARIEELRKAFPDDLRLDIPINTNKFIMESINEVVHTLIEAMVLVFLVVFIFLQNWRATLIPCIAVPVSIIGTFAGIYAFGYSINSLTLFGLVLAIGIVVDDAIVVLENVERIMASEHLPPKEATAKAMSEVTSALISIVLVLCSVFIPVSFMGGLAGQMYKQFAVTISISVVLSGIVALTLTPALCAILLKEHGHQTHTPKFFEKFNAFFDSCTSGYVSAVSFIKDNRIISACLCGLVFAGVFFLNKYIPTSMVPNEDQGYCIGSIVLDDGASVTRTDEVAQKVLKFALKDKTIQDTVTLSGFDLLSNSLKSNAATMFFGLKDWSERQEKGTSDVDFLTRLMALNASQPSGYILGFAPPAISGMSNTGGFEGYIQMKTGESFKTLETVANQFAEELRKRPEVDPVSVRSLFSAGSPQLFAKLDRERCKDMGISISDVFSCMAATFGTTYINDFNLYGRTFQVRMQAESDYRLSVENLNDAYVRNMAGQMLPLSALITLERSSAPQNVSRYNVFPAAQVMGNPAPGYTSGQALLAAEETAATVLPTGYSLGWAGSSLQERIANSSTAGIFVLALVMVFLILAAQYESWSLPLAVLTAVPFAIFGALMAVWVRGLSNDVYFQVALVTLIGLSAKNAILIVEFAVDAWRDGMSLNDAALHASRLRFRPIVMTSLAFILGVLPLAFSSGAGANSRHAIGTAVAGGMLAATCIATLFVPLFFREIMRLSLFLRGKKDVNAEREMRKEEVKS